MGHLEGFKFEIYDKPTWSGSFVRLSSLEPIRSRALVNLGI